MKFVKKTERNLFKNSDACDVFEYDLKMEDFGGAVVEIRGRYPDSGRVVNSICKEAAFIVTGEGMISVEGVEIKFKEGDFVLIEAGEKYFWKGDFSAFLFSVPAWSAEQCKIVD